MWRIDQSLLNLKNRKRFLTDIQYRKNLLGLLAMLLFSVSVLSFFHKAYWLPHDTGVFTFAADALLRGEILSRDFETFHPGYHAFLNAALFELFGRDLLHLRWPLLLASILQSLMLTWMLRRQGWLPALLGGIFTTSFGFIQFLDPTPSWYGLFFAATALFILTEFRLNRWSISLLGLIIGTAIMFRHPTGILIGLSVMTCLFAQHDKSPALTLKRSWLAKIFLLFALFGLLLYMSLTFSAGVFFYLGIWPLGLLILLILHLQVQNVTALKILSMLAVGAMLAILPMLFYLLIWGDPLHWAHTFFFDSIQISRRDFFNDSSYVYIGLVAFLLPFKQGLSIENMLHAIAWLLFLILPMAGTLLSIREIRKRKSDLSSILIFPFIYGLVSFYYQIPIYLYYSLPLYLLALLFHWRSFSNWFRYTISVLVCASCIYGLFFSAAQSGLSDRSDYIPSSLPGVSLKIPADLEQLYTEMLDAIDQHSEPDAPLLVIPSSPELYFLTQRKSPLPYCCSFTSINNDAELQKALVLIENHMPGLFITTPKDKYFGPYEEKLVAILKARYQLEPVAIIGEQDSFRREFHLFQPAPTGPKY